MTASPLTATKARPLDAGAATLTVLMCLVWGLNQVAIKFAFPEIPVFTQAVIRSGGGLLIVLAWTSLRGIPLLRRDGTLIPGIIAGLLFALEFLLIYGGLHFTTASRASLFLYTATFFVALGSRWLVPSDRLGPAQWAGLAMCFVGLALALGVPQASVDASTLIGDVMLIGAGMAWAGTTLVIKATRLNYVTPEKTLIYQLVVSVPVLAAAAVCFNESVAGIPSPGTLGWLAYQVIALGVTFPLWFWLIMRFSATRVSAFSFLAPLFGVAAGCLLLHEPFTLAFGAAVVLVITGLVLVNRPK
jgi:drug/metabolite transporter (DMT)-like permease